MSIVIIINIIISLGIVLGGFGMKNLQNLLKIIQ